MMDNLTCPSSVILNFFVYQIFPFVRDKLAGSPEGFNFADAVSYHYGKFPPKTLNYERLAKPLGTASDALARYDALLQQLHNEELFLAPIQSTEAVVSSRMEGTVATLDEVLTVEADTDENNHLAEPSSYRQEAIEVYSYKRAMRVAQRHINEGLPISSRLFRIAHSSIVFLGRGADKAPGKFKTEQNYIADRNSNKIRFIPIEPQYLEDGISALEQYIHDDSIDCLIQTAIAHIEFEALHPFKDGNGRLGRMLIPLMLWTKNKIHTPHFYLSKAIEERRDEYIERMRVVSSKDEWTEWTIFFLEIAEHQAIQNISIIRNIMTLYDEMKQQFRDILSSRWDSDALDYIFQNPIFRNSSFTKKSGIPGQTAQRLSRQLVNAGILETIRPASGQRPALLAFRPLLDLIRI